MEVPFNMSLLDKLKKNTTIKDSSILAKSKFFNEQNSKIEKENFIK